MSPSASLAPDHGGHEHVAAPKSTTPMITDDAASLGVIDRSIMRASRWLAARTSRRSFLARTGQVGMVVAGGTVLAGVLADQAEARVCGQSGVSPKCPTYDCFAPAVWGWCWYARGCCADGSMKKICDCCMWQWPNVHGYCPSGTNVYCVVESCGTDPRVMSAAITPISGYRTPDVIDELNRYRFPGGSQIVVMTDVEDDTTIAIAAPVARISNAPTVLCARWGLSAGVLNQIKAFGATTVRIVGGRLPSSIDAVLQGEGISVERVGTSTNIDTFSRQVAQWFLACIPNTPEVVAYVEPPGSGRYFLLPLAAAAATNRACPLVIGARAIEEIGLPARCVGAGSGWARDYLAGRIPVAEYGSDDPMIASTQLMAMCEVPWNPPLTRMSVAQYDFAGSLGLAYSNTPIMYHPPGDFTAGAHWLNYKRASTGAPWRMEQAWYSTWGQPLDATQSWYLQSYLNGFDAHLLTGVAGQGLPVISQPYAERPMGNAYVGPAGYEEVQPRGYWTGPRPPA